MLSFLSNGYLFIIIFLVVFSACQDSNESATAPSTEIADSTASANVATPNAEANNDANALVEFEYPTADVDLGTMVIVNEDGTFGYHILQHGKPIIHQTHLPWENGGKGFATKIDANNAAVLAKEKLIKGEFPPVVTEEEFRQANK